MINMFLTSLLEAAGDSDKEKKAKATEAEADTEKEDTADQKDADTNADDKPEESDNQDDTEESPEDDADANTDDEEDPTKDEEKTEEETEENPDSEDFSLDDGEDDAMDSEPNPDGLPNPDDDGSADDEDADGETNVHVNILQLSKLDRALAKRRNFAEYQELRTTITSTRNLIDKNETLIEPHVRTKAYDQLEKLLEKVTDYIMYKFSFTNYEENLQNYMIFTKALNDIVTYIHSEWDIPEKDTKRKKLKEES